jgi:solute carrier family 35 (UDP-sugar transporter), member A1/2/3
MWLPQVLVIIAASHLDAVTFQIGSQSFKILPTALFAAWLLGQRLSGMQWASLPVGSAMISNLLS